jgi:hypothetical protein
MSETCTRAVAMLPQFVDGDLAAEQCAWLGEHFAACAECGAALAGFTRIDSELTGWGKSLGIQNPPPAGAREQLAARLNARESRRRKLYWIPAAAAAIAAALVLTMIPPHKKPAAANRAGNHEEAPFIEIPYLAPPDPRENATIVRVNMRVATLIALGYRVAADPETIVPADVLVGEDGRAHAVRVLSGIEWNGIGD